MGNVVVFRRRAAASPPYAAADGCSTSNASRPVAEAQSVSKQSSIPFNSFNATRCARGLTKASQDPDHDGYLLVLLADQEMIAGRDVEARYLLDAAYAAFDRKIDGELGYEALG
jgi:hypothetical protein